MFYYPVYALFHYYPEAFWIRVAVTAVLLAAGVVCLVLLYKKSVIAKRSMGWGIALWGYTVFLLFITVLGRYSSIFYRARMIPFDSYRELFATGSFSELRGIIGNILMFIPVSFLCMGFLEGILKDTASVRKPVMLTLGSGLTLTVLIEVLQILTRTGTIELDDMMHNLIGTALGVLLWIMIHAVIKRKNRFQKNSL